MATFLSGAADCGPSNALKNVSGRLDVDRGVQQDRFAAGPSTSRPRFQPAQPSAPSFDLAALRQHLEPAPPALPPFQLQPPRHDAAWARAFASSTHHLAPAAAGKGKERAAWAHEFTATSPPIARPQSSPAPWQLPPTQQLRAGGSMHGPIFPQQHHLPHPMPADHYFPPPFQSTPPAFTTYPGLPTQSAPIPHDAVPQPAEPQAASQDVLARTARDLVSGLDAEGLAATNPKLANSQFMQLVRQLGQGDVVVQDPPVAARGPEDVGEGSRLVPRAEWVGDFLDSSSIGRPATSLGNATSLDEQDAILMTDRTSKSVHFDTPATALGNGVPTSLAEALLSQASVPGATSAWEDGALDDDLDVFMAYNGNMRPAQASTHPAAGINGWEGLAEEWDRHADASVQSRVARGMGRGDQEERYLFQAGNPYGAESLAREPSPAVMGVLELEAAVQHAPQDASAWLALGLKQQENEREDAAILALSKAVQLDPDNEDAHLALAVSYTNEGEKEAANTVLERWIELRRAGGGGVAGWAEEREDGAQAASRSALVERLVEMARARPEDVDPDVQIALGVLFNASEEYSKAEDCFLAALSVRPDDWLLYNRLGATLANGGRPNDAIEYYHRALSLHPNFVRALFNLGIAHTSLGQHAHAAQCVLDALRLQQADASEGYAVGAAGRRSKGVTSESLWSSLRSSCLQLDRTDLVLLANRRELTGFPLSLES